MTKKKSLLLQILFMLGACLALLGVLVLTGCGEVGGGSVREREDVAFNGDEYFVTSDYGNVTNQVLFDKMMDSNEGMHAFLNIIDEIVLHASFNVDQDDVDELMETLKEGSDHFDVWMAERGFASEDEVIQIIEFDLLRQEALRRSVIVTDEEIQEVFDLWFGEDEEADFDEMRQEIYDSLVSQQAGELGSILAELRYEAGFVIYDARLADVYAQYLERSSIVVPVPDVLENDDLDVIASVGDEDITIGQLFAVLTRDLGMQTAFDLVDSMILGDQFEVDPTEVDEIIDELRESFGDEFDAIIAAEGFESEAALFDFFEGMLLQEVAFRIEFTPTEARLKELYDEMVAKHDSNNDALFESIDSYVSGYHILVEADDYDLANDLITQLQDTDDFSALFAELAIEYSIDPGSGARGGDLGSWERGLMVEPFEDAIFELEMGEFTTSPVETEFGLHIIYRPEPSEAPVFVEVRDELEAQELSMLQQTGALESWLMDLRLEANVTFTNSVLQEQFQLMSVREQNDHE